jgi:tetratricopeptide (TPR) repeat protein
MKPSSTSNDFLSESELEDYLNGKTDPKAKNRVKKLLEDCELSREALAGFTAVPGALGDVPALKKSIAGKSGITMAKWLNFVVLGLGIAMLIGMGFALWPNGKDHAIVPTQKIDIAQVIPPVENNSQSVSTVEISPNDEHFVNPEMKPTPIAVISQGVAPDSSATAKPIDGNHVPLSPIDTMRVPVVPVVPKNPEVGYNASIGFILDLKITEFEKYYRKTIEVKDVEFTGVRASYDNFADEKTGDEETVRKVPAEDFLNDGLKAFHDGHYGRCIEKMEVLKKNNANDLNAAFYIGVSYVKLEMFAKAIPYFDQVLNSTNNVFHEEASWYKALALIGNGNVEAGKKLLEEISQTDGFYKEKAAAKLKEM